MAKGVKRKENRNIPNQGRNKSVNDPNLSVSKEESVDYTDTKRLHPNKRSTSGRTSEMSTSSISSNSDVTLREEQPTRRIISSRLQRFSTATFAFVRRSPGCTLINTYILKILFWDILVSTGDVVTDFLRVNYFCVISFVHCDLFYSVVFCRKSVLKI